MQVLLLLLTVALVSPTWLDKKVEELDEEELEEKAKEVEEKAEVLGLVILSTRMEDLTPERLRREGELVEEWVVEDRWKGKECQGVSERHMVFAFNLETEGVRERREAEVTEMEPPSTKTTIDQGYYNSSYSKVTQPNLMKAPPLFPKLSLLQGDPLE